MNARCNGTNDMELLPILVNEIVVKITAYAKRKSFECHRMKDKAAENTKWSNNDMPTQVPAV